MGCAPSVTAASTATTTSAPTPLPEDSQTTALAKSRLSLDSREQGDDLPSSAESSLRLLTLDSIRDDEPHDSHHTTTSPMQEFMPLAPMAQTKSQVRSPSSTSRHTLVSQGLSLSVVDDDVRSLSQTEVMMADLHAVSAASGSSRQLLELAHRLPRQFHPGNTNGETGSSCSLVDNDREECERLLDSEDC